MNVELESTSETRPGSALADPGIEIPPSYNQMLGHFDTNYEWGEISFGVNPSTMLSNPNISLTDGARLTAIFSEITNNSPLGAVPESAYPDNAGSTWRTLNEKMRKTFSVTVASQRYEVTPAEILPPEEVALALEPALEEQKHPVKQAIDALAGQLPEGLGADEWTKIKTSILLTANAEHVASIYDELAANVKQHKKAIGQIMQLVSYSASK